MTRKVVCADDDFDDKELICEALSQIDPEIEVIHAVNGVEAMRVMQVLKQRDELPCLVIVDINMPLMDGKQVVRELKTNPDYHSIPVVVVTTSRNPADADFFNTFKVQVLTKPHRIEDFKAIAERLIVLCDD